MRSKWVQYLFLAAFFSVIFVSSGSAETLKFETRDLIIPYIYPNPQDLAANGISFTGIFYVERIDPAYNWVGRTDLAFWAKVVGWDITLNAEGGHGGGGEGGYGFSNDLAFHYTKANSFMASGSPTDFWPVQVLTDKFWGYQYWLYDMPLIYPNGSQDAVSRGDYVPGFVGNFAPEIWLAGQGGQSVRLRGPYVNVSYTTPEPSIVLMLGAGFLGLAGWRRTRKDRITKEVRNLPESASSSIRPRGVHYPSRLTRL